MRVDRKRGGDGGDCVVKHFGGLQSTEAGPLETLAMDNRRSSLIVLLLTDPHLLEGREGGQDGATDPHRVLPFWGSNDLRGKKIITSKTIALP